MFNENLRMRDIMVHFPIMLAKLQFSLVLSSLTSQLLRLLSSNRGRREEREN